ncbi:MAG: rRNA maturation RNase YbeY, partial [Gammaproteobacteria bacterium]|nr:rRNA maturation RNase YbeY [Gammaproteobacteria bacterium]
MNASPVTIELEIQNVTSFRPVPGDEQFRLWVEAALQGATEAVLTLRLVDDGESRKLNERYRGKNRPTNVLSFPADLPEELGIPLLGDIVICAPLVGAEAEAQQKPVQSHWAHLTIHGVLHLLGYDHQEKKAAEEM